MRVRLSSCMLLVSGGGVTSQMFRCSDAPVFLSPASFPGAGRDDKKTEDADDAEDEHDVEEAGVALSLAVWFAHGEVLLCWMCLRRFSRVSGTLRVLLVVS